MRLVIAAALRPDLTRRTLSGTLFRYGEVGTTSAGPLRVRPGAIEVPENLGAVTLTREHEQDNVRGQLALYDDNGERVYVAVRVADGPAGDDALNEANRSRDDGGPIRAGFSFYVEDYVVSGDELVSARLVSVGQVADPAFNSARIDAIAAARAAQQTATVQTTTRNGDTMTPEQIARLAELRSADNLTAEERAELDQLTTLAADELLAQQDSADTPPADAPADAPAAPASAAASRRVPALPSGVPAPARRADTQTGSLRRFCETVVRELRPGGGGPAAITAAFSDVTPTTNPGTEAPAWSGELWSGLQYTPEWAPLFTQGDLTSWEGNGWRWVTKPAMADYAGEKAAVPSAALATEESSYTAARMAVGHDIDRVFYDFPGGAAFLQSYAEAAREDWAVKLDAKVKAYIVAQAVAYGSATTSLLKAAALALFGVKANTRSRGTFVVVNQSDFLDLLDVNEAAVPAFLDTFNVDPSAFVVDDTVTAGTVYAGVKQAATVRTLPGSPIRVDAQHLANGGVDSAFFGYWAIEEHHTSGIVKTTFA